MLMEARSANPGWITGSKSLVFHVWDCQLVVQELNQATEWGVFSGAWECWPYHISASRGSGDVLCSTPW